MLSAIYSVLNSEQALVVNTKGLIPYYLIITPDFLHMKVHTISGIIFALALLQSLVQLIFSLMSGMKREASGTWPSFSTVSIIFIVVFFSIWIMDHLNYNMI